MAVWLRSIPVVATFAIAFGALAWAAQGDVPTLDVSATCRPLGKGDFSLEIDKDRCLKTENEARDTLKLQWAKFPSADRDLCTQTATMAGMESYVQLLTCLELKRDLAAMPPQPLEAEPIAGQPMKDRPANLRGQR